MTENPGKAAMDRADVKKNLRSAVLAKRAKLSTEEHQRRSEIICARLMSDKRIIGAKTVFSYRPFGSEVDIAAFNEGALSRGVLLAFPICHDEGIMEAAVPTAGTALRAGRYGIAEPDPERSRIISPAEFDVVLVPCVGFDSHNIRLGMGGGFYDRYLPDCTGALKLGVAFALQRVEGVFGDPWDTVLDDVITD
jgi:5-formyltetrahydrofolate cyclo-ligase